MCPSRVKFSSIKLTGILSYIHKHTIRKRFLVAALSLAIATSHSEDTSIKSSNAKYGKVSAPVAKTDKGYYIGDSGENISIIEDAHTKGLEAYMVKNVNIVLVSHIIYRTEFKYSSRKVQERDHKHIWFY